MLQRGLRPAGSRLVAIFEQVARLTSEFSADGFERREAHGLGLARLQYRQVGLSETYAFGQFAERNFALGHLHVEVDYYLSHS